MNEERRFKLDEGPSEEPSMLMTSMIDVVFLLLIFFMVSTTFDRHAKLKVELPEASAKQTQQQQQTIVLSIDAKGNYFINDRQLVNTRLETLKTALQKTLADEKDVPLVLRADAKTPHQAVVRAMDAASQLGLTRLSIATIESQ